MAKTKRKIDIKGTEVETIPGAVVALGCKVIDIRTGYRGTCTAVAQHLYACPRVHISPDELDGDGKLRDGEWFDVQGVAVIEECEPQMADNSFVREAKASQRNLPDRAPPGGDDRNLKNARRLPGE